jgi:hypothetical protein
VVGDVLIDSETLLVIDFMNLNIKSTQFFGCAHRDRVCVYVIAVSAHTFMNIYGCTIFLKNKFINFASGIITKHISRIKVYT